MRKDNSARMALAAVAIDALARATTAEAKGDGDSAAVYREIGSMLLGMGEDASTPLLEVASERRRHDRNGAKYDFDGKRRLMAVLVLIEMERQHISRHAACKKVCTAIFAKDGQSRIESAAKELAKHVPLTIAGFRNSEIGRQALATREALLSALHRKMVDKSIEPPVELVYWAVVQFFAGWRDSLADYDKRMIALRSAFNSPAVDRPDVEHLLDSIGDVIVDGLVAEFQPPS